MRLLLDENMPKALVGQLRADGHDVVFVKESMRGLGDGAVLAHAQEEGRLLLTQDKDFGELAYRYGLPAEGGIILFRLSGSAPDVDTDRMVHVLYSREDWRGHLCVVTDDRVRMRALPAGRGGAAR